jgi:hypothetical protein
MTKSILFVCAIVGCLVFCAPNTFGQASGAGASGTGTAGATGGATSPGLGAPGSMPSNPGNTTPSASNPTVQPGAVGSPFSNPPAGGNLPTNPVLQSNGLRNDTNPLPGPGTGNPNAGATTDIHPDSALNRMGIDGRTPEQREATRDARQDMRQDLRNERREDRQADRNSDPNRWRFVLHNGEWWYWMPGDYWMYYRDNNWNRFDPYAYQTGSRYRTGYRGTVNFNNSTNPDEVYFYDENGRRYRRDYSPDRRFLRDPNAGAQMGSAIGGAAGGDRGARIGAEIGGAVDGIR